MAWSSARGLLRPTPWPVDPKRVAPEWSPLFQGMKFLVPFWETGLGGDNNENYPAVYSPINYGVGIDSTQDNPYPVPDPDGLYGSVWEFPEQKGSLTDGEMLIWELPTPLANAASGQFHTIELIVRAEHQPGGSDWQNIAYCNDGSNGVWLITQEVGNVIGFRTYGGNNLACATLEINFVPAWYHLFFVWEVGTGVTTYKSQINQGATGLVLDYAEETCSFSDTSDFAGSHIYVGATVGNDRFNFDGKYAKMAAWDRELSPNEIRRLMVDPWGPIRPVPTRFNIGVPAAGVSDLSISVSDSVTVGDTATVDSVYPIEIAEQEDVTVGEVTTIRLHLDLPAQQENITVGDTATVDPVYPIDITESDGVTVGDTLVDLTITTGITDLNINVQDNITVGDTATVDPLQIEISEVDGVAVGDTATVDPLQIEISEVDGIAVGDTATVDPVYPIDITESDGVTVGDTLVDLTITTGVTDLNINVQDNITVGDTATVDPVYPLEVSEVEAITVGDSHAVDPISIEISEVDGITVGDTATVDPVYPLDISELDAITVIDTPIVSVPAVPDLTINVLDAVSVGDTAVLDPVYPLEIVESDAIVIGESVQLSFVLAYPARYDLKDRLTTKYIARDKETAEYAASDRLITDYMDWIATEYEPE